MQDSTSIMKLIEAGKGLSDSIRYINIIFFDVHQYVAVGVNMFLRETLTEPFVLTDIT